MAKYRPDWDQDYAGGKVAVAMQNKYDGSYYAVSLDGDYQVWVIRQDLFDDAKNRRPSRRSTATTWPRRRRGSSTPTWPSSSPGRPKLLRARSTSRTRCWGYSNWIMRYISAGNPNQYYLDLNMKPLINGAGGRQGDQGARRLDGLDLPDTLSKSWPEQYAAMGAGNAAMATMFSNVTKFIPGSPARHGLRRRSSSAPRSPRGASSAAS